MSFVAVLVILLMLLYFLMLMAWAGVLATAKAVLKLHPSALPIMMLAIFVGLLKLIQLAISII